MLCFYILNSKLYFTLRVHKLNKIASFIANITPSTHGQTQQFEFALVLICSMTKSTIDKANLVLLEQSASKLGRRNFIQLGKVFHEIESKQLYQIRQFDSLVKYVDSNQGTFPVVGKQAHNLSKAYAIIELLPPTAPIRVGEKQVSLTFVFWNVVCFKCLCDNSYAARMVAVPTASVHCLHHH